MPASERERLEGVFARYRASARKQRAWAADNPGNLAIRRELADAVLDLAPDALTGPGPLLDVGCGTGWWLAELAGRGAEPGRLHGIELLEERTRAAAGRVPGAKVVTGDARKLPYADGEFGLVTLFLVLSSAASDADVAAVLCEAARVTRPGGWIVVWEPRIPTPSNRHTKLVRPRVLHAAIGAPQVTRPITLLPPLARRLPSPNAYARLASIPALRTHRLVAWRRARANTRYSDSAARITE